MFKIKENTKNKPKN